MNKECRICKKIKSLDEFYKTRGGYHTSCKLCFSANSLRSYHKTRATRLEVMKSWRVKNSDALRVYKREYNRARYATDPLFRLKRVLRARLNVALKKTYKSGSAIKDLGCSVQELKTYLENQFSAGMSWDNYGRWQIDHKRALATFDLSDQTQLQEAVHFSNLQPMWAEENKSKGAR